jgi:hypothetical protein
MRKTRPACVLSALLARYHVTCAAPVDWQWVHFRYELLTGSPAFPRMASKSSICDQLAGRQPLPWEYPASSEDLEKMKGLKRSVLCCLNRNPASRPTSEILLTKCVALARYSKHYGGDVLVCELVKCGFDVADTQYLCSAGASYRCRNT